MSTSIIPQLVKKDFLLMRKVIFISIALSIFSTGVITQLIGEIPDWTLVNIGILFLLAPVFACGFMLMMFTNVHEKEKSTQSFIMSLPVTVREFTFAKLLFNLPVFSAMWVAVSAVALYICFGLGLFPLGTFPFITIVLLGIYAAYTCGLGISLLFQSTGITILAMVIFEVSTSASLWTIAYMEPIANHIYGANPVWNSTAITIVTVQVLIVIFAIVATLFIQNKKRDFI